MIEMAEVFEECGPGKEQSEDPRIEESEILSKELLDEIHWEELFLGTKEWSRANSSLKMPF